MVAASRSNLFAGKPIFQLLRDHTVGNGKIYSHGTRVWVHSQSGELARVSPLNMRTVAPMNIIFTVPLDILAVHEKPKEVSAITRLNSRYPQARSVDMAADITE